MGMERWGAGARGTRRCSTMRSPPRDTITHDRVDRVDEAGSVTLPHGRPPAPHRRRPNPRPNPRPDPRPRPQHQNHQSHHRRTAPLSDPRPHLPLPTTGNPKGPVPAKTVSMHQRDPQIALTRTWGRDTATKRIAEIGENEGRSWPRRQLRDQRCSDHACLTMPRSEPRRVPTAANTGVCSVGEPSTFTRFVGRSGVSSVIAARAR